MRSPPFAAILVMAGSGSRFGGAVPKVLLPLAGRPVWRHSAETLASVPGCLQIVLVVAEPHVADVAASVTDLPAARVVAGGARRQDSVRCGLQAIDVPAEVVAVHDAARPLVRAGTIARAVAVAGERGAALVAVPVTDTIKVVDEDGIVSGTPDRARLVRAQTPQCFRTGVLLDAHETALRDGLSATDDAALVEACGHAVPVVTGDEHNLKITRPEDLVVAEALLAAREREARGGAP